MLNEINTYYFNKLIPIQPPEKETGNKEYKRRLIYFRKNKKIKLEEFYQKRASQMLYRLIEGSGKALYMLGVDDDGKLYPLTKKELDITLESLKNITVIINSSVSSVRIYGNDMTGFIATVRIILNKNFLAMINNNLLINK